ncbi:MAG: glycosyltransferase [Wenzhouxiangella sp.]
MAENKLHSCDAVGIVVIGRNEASRLPAALDSACAVPAARVIYVDSGSTDGSVAVARERGIEVLSLDARQPFSAARARREGAQRLLSQVPDTQYLHFLDGDSELCRGWVSEAVDFLRTSPDFALVCGMLTERDPNGSVYNKLAALQWDAPVGEIDHCGGIFLVRTDAYLAAGGFKAELLTGEERDLCARIRAQGYRLFRLDRPMAEHDLGFYSFRQWWTRRVWGGHGYALEQEQLPEERGRRRGVPSLMFWGVAVPVASLVGLVATLFAPWAIVVPILGVLLYLVLMMRIALSRVRAGETPQDAVLYGFFCAVQKIAVASGFVAHKLGGRPRPDAHAATEAPQR